MPDEKTPAIDHVLETTLAQCKSLLGEKTYTYTKSLVIDHADIEKMVEEGRGRCTVTLGDMSGTRFERSTAINYEMIVGGVGESRMRRPDENARRHEQLHRHRLVDCQDRTRHFGSTRDGVHTDDFQGRPHVYEKNIGRECHLFPYCCAGRARFAG